MGARAVQVSSLDRRGSLARGVDGGYAPNGLTETYPDPDTGLQDAEAVARIATGDAEALRGLYARYGRMTYSIAYRVVGDPGTAEECVQDVFTELWRHASRYDARRGRVSTWLGTIARNRAIDATRSQQRRAVPSDEPGPDGPADDTADLVAIGDRAVQVADALAALPPPLLEVVQLAYFDELTQSEIAERLRVPLGTIKSRMRAALERLRPVADALRGEDLQ